MNNDAAEREWDRTLSQVEVFFEDHAAWPNPEAAGASEQRLGLWLQARRTDAAQAELSGAQRYALDAMSVRVGRNWDTTPPPAPALISQGKWLVVLSEVEEFYRAHHRWPMVGGDTEDEIRLGHWMSSQRGRERSGELSEERCGLLDQMDARIDGDWRESTGTARRATKWAAQRVAVEEFYLRHHRWPKIASGDPDDNSLVCWLQAQRVALRYDRLSDDHLVALNEMGARVGADWDPSRRRA